MNQSRSLTIDIAEHDDVYEFMFDRGIVNGLPLVPASARIDPL